MDAGRIAGLLYLTMSLLFVAAASIRARIIVPDPTATVGNIRASESLVRVGMAADLLSGAFFLFTAMALYVLLRRVDERLAAAMIAFVVLGVAVGCVSLMVQFGSVAVATQSGYATAIGSEASPSLVAVLSETQRSGLLINELFSGLWLLPLGYLVARSGQFPVALGILLIVGGFAWIAQLFIQVLLPDLSRLASALTLGAVGELVFIGWLIVKGGSA